MAMIHLREIRHSYISEPNPDDEYALKYVDLQWEDGGAYALLGPSGCGKSTLLNIISGLLRPSEGSILFGDRDVTTLSPDQRNIAQVFQFPVVYDTMTVYDNLAFPLRNRRMPAKEIDQRVREIAKLTDLTDMLSKRASGLTADGKQKISLGRGLVRRDVAAILFDEPLTVIDPHLKWHLRSKLKELHQRLGTTMIYVTHDQTEALTFADKVVVMLEGEVLQVGTPIELFERPGHTFVGHFIGSPGMNFLPCHANDGLASFGPHQAPLGGVDGVNGVSSVSSVSGASSELGIRPEFVRFDDHGIAVQVIKISDTGRSRIVETQCDCGDSIETLRVVVPEGVVVPEAGKSAFVQFDPAHTYLYNNGRLVE
ncbi:MAG: ABC transporter ATP-binding protein [Burkholderiaceae bacterium]